MVGLRPHEAGYLLILEAGCRHLAAAGLVVGGGEGLHGGARGDAHLARVPRYLLLHHPRRLGRHRAVVVQGEVVGLVTGVPGTASVRATE